MYTSLTELKELMEAADNGKIKNPRDILDPEWGERRRLLALALFEMAPALIELAEAAHKVLIDFGAMGGYSCMKRLEAAAKRIQP